MRPRLTDSPLPVPLRDMLLFATTAGGFLLLWRVSGNAVDCNAWAGAVGCAVGLGWWDNYRRDRERAGAAARSSSA